MGTNICFFGRNRRAASGLYDRAGARGWIVRVKADGIVLEGWNKLSEETCHYLLYLS